MKIPARFELQGRTIKVIYSKRLKGHAYAQWEPSKDRITIDPTASVDMRLHAFLHEFCHAALEALGRDDLSEDEKFVDALSGLMHQMLKTRRHG